MSVWSKIQNLPYTQQLPSYCVAEIRTWLPEYCERVTDTYVAWPGRTYPRRLVKPMVLCGLSGAIAPAQSELVSAGAWFVLSRLMSESHGGCIKLPYVRAPISSWIVLGAACVLVGTAGAPRNPDRAEPEADEAMGQIPSEHPSAFPSDTLAADLQASLPGSGLQNWAEFVVHTVGQITTHGVLGLSQMALEAEGGRRAERGQNQLAWACRTGAAMLLWALEPARLALQVVYLGLELALALPFAAMGALVGMGVFGLSMHVDPWAEVRDGMAVG